MIRNAMRAPGGIRLTVGRCLMLIAAATAGFRILAPALRILVLYVEGRAGVVYVGNVAATPPFWPRYWRALRGIPEPHTLGSGWHSPGPGVEWWGAWGILAAVGAAAVLTTRRRGRDAGASGPEPARIPEDVPTGPATSTE